MGSRDLDAASLNAIAQSQQHIIWGLKLQFDTSDIRIHTGIGEQSLPTGSSGSNETYEGAGTLLSISDVEDTAELKSAGMSFGLSGMNPTVLNYALTEDFQNRLIFLFIAFLDAGTTHVNGFFTLFRGRMTNIDISDNPQSDGISLTVSAENRLVDLGRPTNFKFTNESQQFLHSGDTAFDQVQVLSHTDIKWGLDGGGALDMMTRNQWYQQNRMPPFL